MGRHSDSWRNIQRDPTIITIDGVIVYRWQKKWKPTQSKGHKVLSERTTKHTHKVDKKKLLIFGKLTWRTGEEIKIMHSHVSCTLCNKLAVSFGDADKCGAFSLVRLLPSQFSICSVIKITHEQKYRSVKQAKFDFFHSRKWPVWKNCWGNTIIGAIGAQRSKIHYPNTCIHKYNKWQQGVHDSCVSKESGWRQHRNIDTTWEFLQIWWIICMGLCVCVCVWVEAHRGNETGSGLVVACFSL